MAADAYAGQGDAEYSVPTAIRNNPDNVAPADRPGYNPKANQWANVPGAAARAQGYPRA